MDGKLEKVNLASAFNKIDTPWVPHIAGEVNDSYVKLGKFEGEFTWHQHPAEDEMFLVIRGEVSIQFREQDTVSLQAGEFMIVPKGVEHKPVSKQGADVLLFESKSTLNTGDVRNDFTIDQLKAL